MLHEFIELAATGVIEGKGLVSTGLIHKGEVVSQLEPDQPLTAISEFLTWSEEEQEQFIHYAYQYSETHLVAETGMERFMNHSCDPNTWWLDNDTMIARRDIHPGEEITYDYATTEVDFPFEMVCRCGAKNCRGKVTNFDYQHPAWQHRFGDYLPQHTKKAIEDFQSVTK